MAAALVLLAGTAVGWQESTPSPAPASTPASSSAGAPAPTTAPEPDEATPAASAPGRVSEAPAKPAPAPAAAPAPAKARPAPAMPVYRVTASGRKIIDGPPTALAFKNVSVDQIVPFIVEATGKVVMPQQDILTRKITILNNVPIPREQALDLVIQGLQQNGVACAENETTITMRDIAELTREDVPHISPDQSTLSRTDYGWFAEKVFQLKHTTAKAMGDVLKNSLPDYAKMTISDESNSIGVLGNISLLQRVERLINSLDRPSAPGRPRPVPTASSTPTPAPSRTTSTSSSPPMAAPQAPAPTRGVTRAGRATEAATRAVPSSVSPASPAARTLPPSTRAKSASPPTPSRTP